MILDLLLLWCIYKPQGIQDELQSWERQRSFHKSWQRRLFHHTWEALGIRRFPQKIIFQDTPLEHYKFKSYGTAANLLGRERKSNISSRAISNLVRTTKRNPRVTRHLLDDLMKTGTSVSVATIRHAMNKQGLHGIKPWWSLEFPAR